MMQAQTSGSRLAAASIPLLLIFLVFTLSGLTGLIYETVWTRYLKLILGHAAYAQSLVLAIFMGGMALGAWLASRYSRRFSNPLRGYAIVEAVIGVSALVFHMIFVQVDAILFNQLLPGLTATTTIVAVKWGVAGMLILPQSILLGSTFPLMSAALIRVVPDRSGYLLGMLYFTNSIGAAIGALLAVFLLVPATGLPGTLTIAGICNLVIAGVSLYYARHIQSDQPQVAAQPVTKPGGTMWLLLVAAFITGLASFCYEIGWIRMLSLVLGSSEQSFEIMLSAFIAGLALGSLWIRKRLRHIQSPLRYGGHVQILMGVLALATLGLYNASYEVMAWLKEVLPQNADGYMLFSLGSHAIALMIMLPATFMAGMTLPLFTHTLLKAGHGEKSIGRIYAANTLGAIIGVLLAVNLIMPQLGTKSLISLGALADIILGIVLLFISIGRIRRIELAASSLSAALIFFFVSSSLHFDPSRMASGVFRYGIDRLPDDVRVIYHRDGKTASVSLNQYPDGGLSLRTNGKPDATIMMRGDEPGYDEPTMILSAGLGLAYKPHASQVAVIGLGSGLSSNTYLTSPSVESVDTIEIEQYMLEAAKHFEKYSSKVFTDPRSHIYIEDARTFFSSQRKQYDIVFSEPSNPWVSGIANLFTHEFYTDVTHYLKKDGLFLQWLQLYETNMDIVASVMQSIESVFDDYVIFSSNNTDILIIASQQPIPDISDDIFNYPGLVKSMNRVKIRHMSDIAIHYLGNREYLSPLFATYDVPDNSDYYPYLAMRAPRSMFTQDTAESFILMRAAPFPELPGFRPSSLALVTTVTPDPHFLVSQGQLATKYYVDVMLGKPVSIPGFSENPVVQAINRLQSSLTDCMPEQLVTKQFLKDMHNIAIQLNPNGNEAMIDQAWQPVLTSSCFATLPEEVQLWASLYHAIGSARPVQMLEHASQLLARFPPRDNRYTYLLVAGINGALMSRNPEAGRRLWQQYGMDTPVQSAKPMYLRLLLAHLLRPAS